MLCCVVLCCVVLCCVVLCCVVLCCVVLFGLWGCSSFVRGGGGECGGDIIKKEEGRIVSGGEFVGKGEHMAQSFSTSAVVTSDEHLIPCGGAVSRLQGYF